LSYAGSYREFIQDFSRFVKPSTQVTTEGYSLIRVISIRRS
jgi:hypothetical protein